MNSLVVILALAAFLNIPIVQSAISAPPLLSWYVATDGQDSVPFYILRPGSEKPRAPKRILDDSLGVEVTAISVLVEDGETGAPLWEKNPDDLRSIASITKLATLMVALEGLPNRSEIITIAKQDYTSLGYQTFSVGDTVSIHDLIAAAIITSDNVAANALARASGLDTDAFISAMNKKAIELKLKQTHFADFSGLSDENQSTAREVIQLARAAFADPLIRSFANQKSYTITKNGDEQVLIHNTNRLIGGMIDISAGKTGFVTESGYNLVAESERDSHTLFAVVLGSASNEDRFQDYKMATHWTWEHFTWPK